MMSARFFYGLGLSAYFGLLLLLLLWITWLSPPARVPPGLLLLLLSAPLLCALRGVLRGRVYTFQWLSFLSLGYFVLGIDAALTRPAEQLLGIMEIICSGLLFAACLGYARTFKTPKHPDAV